MVSALLIFLIFASVIILSYNSPAKIRDVVISYLVSIVDSVLYEYILNRDDLMIGSNHSYHDNLGFNYCL